MLKPGKNLKKMKKKKEMNNLLIITKSILLA